jgi:hypothetical protein
MKAFHTSGVLITYTTYKLKLDGVENTRLYNVISKQDDFASVKYICIEYARMLQYFTAILNIFKQHGMHEYRTSQSALSFKSGS